MRTAEHNWKLGGGLSVFLTIAFPLWREFSDERYTSWNIFLAAVLIGLAAGALMLNRYFSLHADEIGEARFNTANQDVKHG